MKMRTIATPLTIGSFILVSVTGLFMFFEIQVGLIKPAHEYLSLVFLAGALLHCIVHWKAICNHFRTPLGKGLTLLFVGLSIVAVIPSGLGEHEDGEDGEHIARKATIVLFESDLNGIAILTHRSTTDVVKSLQNQGLANVDANHTVQEVAKANQKSPATVLALLLKNVPVEREDD
jgi:hypothetical protein